MGIICLLLVNLFVFLIIENHYVSLKADSLKLYGTETSRKLDNVKLTQDSYITKLIKDVDKHTDSRIYVVDVHGIVQYDSEQKSVCSNLSDLTVVRDAIRGSSSVEKSVNEKSKILYYSEPFYYKGKIKGAVIFRAPLDKVYKSINALKRQIIVISAIILLFIIILSNAVANTITKPIGNVIGAIKSMAEGNLKQKVEVKGDDEIARLCAAFNNMNEKVNLMDQQRRLFVADASHELKSPLASIKVLVQSLQSGGINDKDISCEFLQDIDDEVNRLTSIVNSLLELTKLEGSYGVTITDFDLNDLCKEVISKLRPINEKRNVKINYSGTSTIIDGNRDNIFRAIYNIIENAIKYSNDGSSVNVKLKREKSYVKVYIRDLGVGIPEEDIKKIFERFYRVDKTRARKTGGSGLGLSIAMEIVKRHNGKIEVESNIGKGSTFIISLPYKFKA